MPNQWPGGVVASPLLSFSPAWNTIPGKATSTHPRSGAQHSAPNKSATPEAPGPASASCSWGAVTSQIPASRFLCLLQQLRDSAGVYSALAGPAPGLAAARRAGGGAGRAAAAARPPRGQSRPRAALRRPPRDAAGRRVRSPSVTRF
ncbi:uncharacterized protein LOC131481133 [Ochotona princeps]|uniref:uncharacterized protein LOC131481133 n=1 Tax=Ochotona princeps TaxID=9978 RepID=UPI0027152A95|nr:uncharacterized protein LOC131481133 [Ochotona princeps]